MASCKTKGFGSAGDLKRHLRSIHGQGAHSLVCPIAGCKRSQRGFSRRDNLSEYLKRVHKVGKDTVPEMTISLDEDFGTVAEEVAMVAVNTMETSANVEEKQPASPQLLDKIALVNKLHKLEKSKSRIYGNIVALRRVLAIA